MTYPVPDVANAASRQFRQFRVRVQECRFRSTLWSMSKSRTTQRDETSERLSVHHGDRGEQADSPRQIPRQGWFAVTKRAWAEAKEDQVPLLAAGVAFKAFLAIFPALTAAFLVWGIFGNTDHRGPDQRDRGDSRRRPGPRHRQVDQVASGKSAAGITAVVAILLALWSASSGVENLMAATNLAYDEKETRGFVKRKGTALLLTVGAIVFMLLAIAFIGVVPVLVSALGPAVRSPWW